MVIEAIEIHFDEDEGHLRLDCRDEEFTHLRDVVLAESSAEDRLSPFIDGIQSIVVRRIASRQETAPRRFGRGVRILLISLALCISLAIQGVGIFAIVWWFRRPGP